MNKFEDFLSTRSIGWELDQPVQQILVEVHYSSRFKFGEPGLVLIISPSLELKIMHCLFVFFFFDFLTL